MAPIRVGITGSHGVGKTTLATHLVQALSEEGSACRLYSRVSQEVSEDLPRNEDATVSTYLAYATVHLRNVADAEAGVVSVYDRSLLDLVAYARANDHRTDDLGRMFTELLRLYLPQFDVLAYLPPEFPLVPAPTRGANPVYRDAVDAELRELCSEQGVVVVSGSVEQRTVNLLKLLTDVRRPR